MPNRQIRSTVFYTILHWYLSPAGHFGQLEPAPEVSVEERSELGFEVKVIPAFRHVDCLICDHGFITFTFNLSLTATMANRECCELDCKHNTNTIRSGENDIQ
jgi:hypothetical protein